MQWTDHLELYSTCTSSTRAVTECLHTCNEDTPVLDHLAPSRCLKIPAQNTNTLTYCQQPPCLQNTKRQWRPTIQQQIWEHCQCRSDRYSPKWALIASIISAFLVPVLIWSILTHSRSTGSVNLPSYTTKPFSTSHNLWQSEKKQLQVKMQRANTAQIHTPLVLRGRFTSHSPALCLIIQQKTPLMTKRNFNA